MKIKIEYEYIRSNTNPYSAFAYLDGELVANTVSKISYEDAEAELMVRLINKRDSLIDYPTPPEPKEVEI